MNWLKGLLVLGLLLGTAGLALYFEGKRPGCPADVARLWALGKYRERVAPQPQEPWPLLTPMPGFSVSVDPDSVRVDFDESSAAQARNWQHFERLTAVQSEPLALPGEPGLTIELAAWRLAGSEWLDPVTGEPAELPERLHPGYLNQVNFIFRLSVPERAQGDLAGMVRVHGVSLFDTATGVLLNGGSSWSLSGDSARVGVSVEMGHRANLMLELPLTYGFAATERVPLLADQSLTLGREAELRIIHVGSGRLAGTSTSTASSTLSVEPNGPGEVNQLVGYVIWPQLMADRVLIRPLGAEAWSTPFSSNRLGALSLKDSAIDSLEVRMLPYAARVQFRIPMDSSLPEVTDLFELVPEQWGKDRSAVEDQLSTMLQINLGRLRRNGAEPMEIDPSATAGEVLQRLLDDSDATEGLHYDSRRFEVTTDSASILFRATQWFRRLLP